MMGCTESILSAVVAKSNGTVKASKVNAQGKPPPLRSDRHDREGAREKRQRAIADRHAKSQSMAKIISDNAMAEKERLSCNTWMSNRSEVSSNVVSPAVSISVRGSDGTASPDNNNILSPAFADRLDEIPSQDDDQGIHANDMQNRTMELPNQVTDESDGAANRVGRLSEPTNSDARLGRGHNMDAHGRKKVENGDFESKRVDGTDGERSRNVSHVTSAQHKDATLIEGDMKNEQDGSSQAHETGKEVAVKEKGKRKHKRKHKEVKFQVSDLTEDSSRTDTSQGR